MAIDAANLILELDSCMKDNADNIPYRLKGRIDKISAYVYMPHILTDWDANQSKLYQNPRQDRPPI